MNEIINEQMSPEMQEFINGLPADKRGANVYEIICEDRNGNITERKFGINVMTNAGFQKQWIETSTDNYPCVVLGIGTGIPDITDTDLFNRLTQIKPLAETTYNDGVNTQGCIFDRDTGNIIGRRKTGQFVIDYNYDGIDSNLNITEYGECGSYYSLDDERSSVWSNIRFNTHCLVYDANHDPSYFTKRIDEKVTVSVYRANMINASVLNDLWTRGLYMFMWPSHLIRANSNNSASYPQNSWIMCGRCRTEDDFPLYENSPQKYDAWGNGRDDLNVYANAGFGRNNYCCPSSCTIDGKFTNKKSDEYWYRNNGTHAEFLMNNKYQSYGMRVVDCWGINSWGARTYKMRDIFYLFEKINLDEPEEITFNNAFTDSCFHPRFNNCFGLAHVMRSDNNSAIWDKVMIPVNDFHITACKRYNYLTDDYDIIEQFVDDPTYDFRNPERGLWGYYYDDSPDHPVDIPKTYNVYLNITDVPIIGFRESNTQRIWMTDAYWDTTTFTEVLDFNNVPAALQHKKYIIKTPDQVITSNDASQAYGIHPIREPNKHALVPSAPIVDVNLSETLTMRDYGNRNGNQNEQMYFKMIYASDDGWIVCENTLIYPESDDGTGHPYMYTLFTEIAAPASFDFRYNRYTDHHIIVTRNPASMVPTNSTNPRIIVVTPDPAHPDVDPMTTAVRYYDSDIMPCFGESSSINNSFDVYAKMFVDPHKDRLLLARGNWSFANTHLVSLGLASHDVHVMDNTTNFYTPRCGMVWGTDNFVWLGEITETDYVYYVYDLANEQIVCECNIPIVGTYSAYGVFGFKDMIYAMIYQDNESYYVHMYDYTNDTYIGSVNQTWANLYYYEESYWVQNMQSGNIDYDDDTFIVHSCNLTTDNNNRYSGFAGRNSMAIFADDLENPCFFSVGSENCLFSYFIGTPRIKKMNGGKDYVALLCGQVQREAYNTSTYSGRSYTMPWVINLGYIKNKGYKNPSQIVPNTPLGYHRTPTFGYLQAGSMGSSNTDWYQKEGKRWWGEFTLYKNYFVSITNLAEYKCKLVPIELLLPHQLTGTTRTIQSYNNPKKFSSHSVGLYITNRLS